MKKLLIASILCFAFCNIQAQYADCDNAIFLCSKERVLVKTLKGAGTNRDELSMLSCSEKLNEVNSAWIKFKVAKSGSLDFTLFPLQLTDDIDFVFFASMMKVILVLVVENCDVWHLAQIKVRTTH